VLEGTTAVCEGKALKSVEIPQVLDRMKQADGAQRGENRQEREKR
jgi:hypothetical protein